MDIEERRDYFFGEEGFLGRTPRTRDPVVTVTVEMEMSYEEYLEFSRRYNTGVEVAPPHALPGRNRRLKPKPAKMLPPASPKLPAHDPIDAEFVDEGD